MMMTTVAPLPQRDYGPPPGFDPGSRGPPEPPHNLEMEAALVGAALRNNRAYDDASAAGLVADHFYAPEHQRIWQAIGAQIEAGQTASPVTLRHVFAQDSGLEPAGGADYLFDLAANVVAVVNAGHYAAHLIDLHRRRALIAICGGLINRAFDTAGEQDAAKIIETASAELDAVAETGAADSAKPVTWADAAEEMLTRAEAIARGDIKPGLTTGFAALDEILGGMTPSRLYIVGGRPGMGKSAASVEIAYRAAMSAAELGLGRVLFIQEEMTAEEMIQRKAADLSGIIHDKIRDGRLSGAELSTLREAMHAVRQVPIDIVDRPGLTVAAVRRAARTIKRRHGLALVVIDYLQKLAPDAASAAKASQNAEVSAITNGLKSLAKDLGVPVLALSQLSRKVEEREDKRPQMADLRDSGSIEQDADVVIFVYREEYYLERSEPAQGERESMEKYSERKNAWTHRILQAQNTMDLIVAKNRHGRVGTVTLGCDLSRFRLADSRDALRNGEGLL